MFKEDEGNSFRNTADKKAVIRDFLGWNMGKRHKNTKKESGCKQ